MLSLVPAPATSNSWTAGAVSCEAESVGDGAGEPEFDME
jgi:hypothetical protein